MAGYEHIKDSYFCPVVHHDDDATAPGRRTGGRRRQRDSFLSLSRRSALGDISMLLSLLDILATATIEREDAALNPPRVCHCDLSIERPATGCRLATGGASASHACFNTAKQQTLHAINMFLLYW